MKKAHIKIIIADDHVLFIEGLKSLFATEGDMEIIDVANDGKELLEVLNVQQPDIVLIDVNMPKLNGLEALKHIRRSHPQVKIVVLSTYNEEHLIDKAKAFGANGYQLKNCSKEELLQTVRLVIDGFSIYPARPQPLGNEFDGSDTFLKQFNLTKRELEIISYIRQDYTNQEIADKLYLSVYTVDTHRKNIMQKLGINKPGALMKFILKNNL